MYDVAIIDDERELAITIEKYFSMFGLSAKVGYGAEAIGELEEDIKVVLLDVNLGMSCGFDLIAQIKIKCPHAKVLLISARSEERDMIKGYYMGADDYITKPFSLKVLLLKVRNLISSTSVAVETYRDLQVDVNAITVKKDGEIIKLKNMEFKLFYYLFCNRGKVLDKDDIIRAVWGEGYYTDNTLNVHIRRIREKLEKNHGQYIETVWGIGYKFE